MTLEFYAVAVGLLMCFAVFDLIVGVSNDAVNFLNSSIGSRVAPFTVIMAVASLGILVGVTFAGGMMEVARKGMFHPQFFTMPELLTIFVAVMLADILLLDLFNTFGLPTSTTVSIVFDLLGAAVAVSLIKISRAADGLFALSDYINTSKVLTIISGILLSIAIAFVCGAIIQYLTRLLFTFDYKKNLPRYGALWGGMALASITFFILIKGAKGASFITPEMAAWISTHALLLLFAIFALSALILQLLLSLFKINILKPVVLVGTFALAMAFAANDLVNFIGVPLAGLQAYTAAAASADPVSQPMTALNEAVHPQLLLLLLSGLIMVCTLWFSRKARTVTETEISLGQQEEGAERFESIWLSRVIVRMGDTFLTAAAGMVPQRVRAWAGRRADPAAYRSERPQSERPSFDLVRAAVNLMVSSAVISLATSMKLPLSTTYVTFMVAMGSSFSDRAWGRESAVYRVTGVLTVIGGWFLTAFIAFVTAFVFAGIIAYLKAPGALLLLAFAAFAIYRNHKRHRDMAREKEHARIFTMVTVVDPRQAILSTFEHLGILLREIKDSLDASVEGLVNMDLETLNLQRKKVRQCEYWASIITANIFKVLRVLQKQDPCVASTYSQIVRRLQRLCDGQRDIVDRAFLHLANNHKGLTPDQAKELRQMKARTCDILSKTQHSFQTQAIRDYHMIAEQFAAMRDLESELHRRQVERILSQESKTRLSIMFYAVTGDCILIAKQSIKLLRIFNESFQFDEELARSYCNIEGR